MRRQDDSFPRSNPSYLSHSLPLCKTLFVGILMICLLLPVSYLMFTAGFKIGEGISILLLSIKSSISALEEDASESILIPKEPLNLRMSSLKDPPLPSCPVYKDDRETLSQRITPRFRYPKKRGNEHLNREMCFLNQDVGNGIITH